MEARAYWTVAPREGELRGEPLRAPGPGEVLVRTLASGISHGTELLVHRHEVPDEARHLVRAPFQVVVLVAAGTAAAFRALGWAA